MKKIAFLFLITLSFYSCSLDNDSDDNFSSTDVFLPVENVLMPSEFVLGETYAIEYTYNRPSTCHSFVDIYQDINLNIRTIAIISRVTLSAGECVDFQEDELITRSFNVTIDNTETYIYKFWQGIDSNGEDVYLQIEVPVIE